MQLNKIFKEAPNIKIEHLTIDSRVQLKNSIFFCIDGEYSDGHNFVAQAIENGAVCIVHTKEIKKKRNNIVYIKVENMPIILNYVTNIFYEKPSEKMFMYGITGTNGKTTIALIISEIGSYFEKTGYIGTLGFRCGTLKEAGQLTTPDTITLTSYLAKMQKENAQAIALEVSSHGIALQRIENIQFDLAIFTNITHDHLDFHNTFENYLATKQRLFKEKAKISLLNHDDKYFESFKAISNVYYTYGKHEDATYRIENIHLTQEKSIFDFVYKKERYTVETYLLGEYNVYNMMAAIAALHLRGFKLEEIIANVSKVKTIDGRMMKIASDSDYHIFIDYAHTPDGIEKVMEYAKTITPAENRIIAVFGSAGRRDYKKRPLFGTIADKYCDQIILTEDDPRDESIKTIAKEIKAGIGTTPSLIVENRYEAINIALDNANKNDTILILGKGNEQFMYRGNKKEPWIGDDKAVIEILQQKEKENELQ